jgi:hypothetical protein
MAETPIQFLERWRQAHVYAELRALEQLDETVAECIGARQRTVFLPMT